ncbi:hypothetical protein [Runella sp.]|uniref:hypothetical protein n=1 Tax=Runella sp. TaxID=1960881 RepID=UPI003D1164C0
METQIAPQPFTGHAVNAQILPLTSEDKAKLEKQKKIVNYIILGVITFSVGFAVYQIFFRDLSILFALIITMPSIIVLGGIFRFFIMKKINEALRHQLKHIGGARIVSKGSTSNTYWVMLDWSFKDLQRVYVTAGMYYSVQKNDLVQIEVLPTSKTALSLKKQF